MLDLLTEPLITVETAAGDRERRTLPGVLAELSAGNIAAFPALRPHQRHPWHAFLCQLAAMALMTADETELPVDEDSWRTLLRRLAPDWPDDEPWSLVVEDVSKPAFLQPPIDPAMIAKKDPIPTPDALDVLVTSKNHDLKQRVAAVTAPESWLFALITLQTTEGVMGAGNYGISRMNKGLGSRPCLTLAPAGGPSAAFRRDTMALPGITERIESEYDFYRRDGIGLVWLVSWTNDSPLSMTDMHPLYIESARRVRLSRANDTRLFARAGNSKSARIDAKHLNGLTGDPWAPMDIKNNKLLTLGGDGFTYRRLSTLLFDRDWRKPPLATPRRTDPPGVPMILIARCLVRGQGKTEGYHERMVPLTPKVIGALGGKEDEAILGDLSRARIEDAGKLRRVLSESVAVLAAGGTLTDKGYVDTTSRRETGYPWADRLETDIDAGFFDALWAEYEAPPDERPKVRQAWIKALLGRASDLLDEAVDSLPLPTSRRYRAMARARRHFDRRKRDAFPDLFPVTPKTPEAPNND